MNQRRLRLSIHAEAGKNLVPDLRRGLLGAHRLLKRCRLEELSVALLGDAKMRQLHARHLHQPTVTDVLTFELEHDARGRVIGGEVIVCVPQAQRQSGGGEKRTDFGKLRRAEESGRSGKTFTPALPRRTGRGRTKTSAGLVGRASPAARLKNEVLLCALHGMLHLCGFDDRTERQYTAMHRAEDRLLSRLGIGPVFGPAARSEPNR
jgi:probable rRNA maturation factor